METPAPAFATPLPQSPRSNILEWPFPKPYHQWILTGRSRAAWHTSFVIPQLNLLLDAGLCVNKLRPKHIFITHGHADHSSRSPAFVKREDPPDVFCPAEMKKVFNDFILANTMLNLGGLVRTEDAEAQGIEMGDDAVCNDEGRTPGEQAFLNTHITHGVRHGDIVPLRRLKGMSAEAFDCDHTVPSLGFVFRSTTNKLKQEYMDLPGDQIRDLRKSGVEISAPQTTAVFAFLGDTTASTLASEPTWLKQGIPVVITECSFLYPEHQAQAEKTKHTYWPDLEKVIKKWPQTTFILMHFSMRYSDREIANFFRSLPDCPQNIVIWADGMA